MLCCFCFLFLLQELLEYLDGLIKEYDKYVDEDGNFREDVADKQSAEIAVEEIQLRYNSFVNKNPLLRELLQKGKDNPSGSQVCISPVQAQSDGDFVAFGGKENTDASITAYNTNQTELSESIGNDKDKYNNIGRDIAAHKEEYVNERTIIGISTIISNVPVSPKNDTITNKITNYYGKNHIFSTKQSKRNAPKADGAHKYMNKYNSDQSIPGEVETPMDRSIDDDSCQPSSSENDNRTNEACHSDKPSQDSLQASHHELSVSTVKAERLHKSQICERNFKYLSDRICHNRVHIGHKPCNFKVCRHSFTESSSLTDRVLIHTGMKPFKCTVCDKSFRLKRTLNTHMRIHTGEKPYKCKVCGQSFTHSSTLKDHVLIHTGEKPFKCTVCDKSFRQKSTLNTHMLIHTGEKPYKCKVCGQSFTHSGTLTDHVLIHTGEKPFKCTVCDKSFRQRRYLTTHMLIHTGEKL